MLQFRDFWRFCRNILENRKIHLSLQSHSSGWELFQKIFKYFAEIAQLVEHNLAKVGVASSSLVFRSMERLPSGSLFFCLTVPAFEFSDMCAEDPHPTLWETFPLHTSRFFSRHLRRGPSSYALGGISPAHISVFLPTSAQGILILRHEWHSPCAHVVSLSF